VTNTSELCVEDVYQGGFVAGLLTARYYALRHPLNGETFGRGAPSEVPTIVYLILERLPRAIVDDAIFNTSWRALDHLLLCDSTEQLEVALTTMPGLSFH
jgi:hypothetical protein